MSHFQSYVPATKTEYDALLDLTSRCGDINPQHTFFVVGQGTSRPMDPLCPSHSNDGEVKHPTRGLSRFPSSDHEPGDPTPDLFLSQELSAGTLEMTVGIPECYPKEGEHHEPFGAIGLHMQVGISESTCSGVLGGTADLPASERHRTL